MTTPTPADGDRSTSAEEPTAPGPADDRAATATVESATTSGGSSPPVPTTAAKSKPPVTAAVRWTGYFVLLAGMLGMGLLLSWRSLRPAFLVPEWMWWFITGAYGEAFWITSVVLAAGMAQDGADVLLRRGWQLLGRLAVVLAIAALAALAVWSYQHDHRLLALMSVLMASVGPLARRALPGLPRAQARIRR